MEQLYIDTEDGWYSVFGSDSGKCYAQYGSKEHAEKYIKVQTNQPTSEGER